MAKRLASASIALAALAPAAADQPVWATFNGDLAATKFADVESFTPETVGRLIRAWDVHTGDVLDGSGERPGRSGRPRRSTPTRRSTSARPSTSSPPSTRRRARSGGATTATPRWRR